ncbi:type II toxin-antitoxin system RelB/DinJ family antitoxin [Escherichia coli]|uniref:type II toxin-antitoxin system RelB/DinJ family antitoxin n=1 Tax=Escherichia coli TaxID=562 RepID=UPI00098B7E9E|nr:type II toxin-antitoxin system RelB/DinJ family antitoxin [Escherichia coli]HBW3117770.1 type II toxin-antitoxin system RelB/DinJ family antitoxin [Klebsiella pneumoniae]EEU9178214.1 type II toxin-antitoxin system RelB/DinJ family antitoxin [Escherichia coli]EEU9182780.1 type II toxin-antitoxin system RelB/DinJ family antitoxin [Escherichia coli]EEW2467768.1 type II toxin-antitoxin system RelB/DinJ family antitoxin [Escherichia coli]EFB3632969.1 type II toxin-antitoxin system RelB/DinJ fami
MKKSKGNQKLHFNYRKFLCRKLTTRPIGGYYNNIRDNGDKMMAAINIKIDDNLKDTGDAILRELGLNATQYITLCWQYLAQHRKLPFMTETKILTASDLTMTIATQFRDVLNQLHKIRDMLNSEGTDFSELSAAKQALSRLSADIQQNGWRLESMPEDLDASTPARRMLPRINYYLTGCDFALSDLPAELPVPTRIENEFGISLKAFETEFARLQSVLTDTGLLARPAPAREFVYRGENVTVSVVQPEDYQHGAWLVRMQAKSVDRENALEDAALTFPALEGRVFLPGTVYGKAVRNSLTGKYEMGFCFLSGITEFHMYSSGQEEEGNPTSPDQVASRLSACVDQYVLKSLQSISGN